VLVPVRPSEFSVSLLESPAFPPPHRPLVGLPSRSEFSIRRSIARIG